MKLGLAALGECSSCPPPISFVQSKIKLPGVEDKFSGPDPKADMAGKGQSSSEPGLPNYRSWVLAENMKRFIARNRSKEEAKVVRGDWKAVGPKVCWKSTPFACFPYGLSVHCGGVPGLQSVVGFICPFWKTLI